MSYPAVGFGTFLLKDEVCYRSLNMAYENGLSNMDAFLYPKVSSPITLRKISI
jgi:diketogulonate reductase-like aldo/keto reductase